MDRYFYSIELNNNGKKVVHLYSNVYLNDSDETETNYRHAEWTFFYIPVDELVELVKNNLFYEYVNEKVNYLADITKSEAIEICENYFDGNHGDYLYIENINKKMPCGDYWSE